MPGNWTILGNVTKALTPSTEELEIEKEIARYGQMTADIWGVCSPILLGKSYHPHT